MTETALTLLGLLAGGLIGWWLRGRSDADRFGYLERLVGEQADLIRQHQQQANGSQRSRLTQWDD